MSLARRSEDDVGRLFAGLRQLWPIGLVLALTTVILAAFAIYSASQNSRAAALAAAQRDALTVVERVAEVEPRFRTDEALVLAGLVVLRNASEDTCPMLPDGRLLLRIDTQDGRTAGSPEWSPGLTDEPTIVEGNSPPSNCAGSGARYVGVVQSVGPLTIAVAHTYDTIIGGPQFWLVVGYIAVLSLLAIAILTLRRQARDQRELARLAVQIDRLDRGDILQPIGPVDDVGLQSVVELVNRLAGRMTAIFGSMRRLQGFVTHDIGNPLLVAERLLTKGLGANDMGERAAEALQQVRLADQRRRAALDLITASTPAELAADSRVDLRDRIDRLVDTMFTYLAEDDNLSITVTGTTGAVAATNEQFDRMLENVLLNAVQHAEPGSEITITLERDGPDGVIAVSNIGPRVSDAMLEKIFDNGVRASSQAGGYGIGLAITRAIAQSCGGKVSGQNTGDGFRLEIRLPQEKGEGAIA